MTPLSFVAVDWLPWIVGLCVLSAVVLLLIVIAPWKKVRDDSGIDDEVEARLLLGEDPDEIDRDLAAREAERRARCRPSSAPDDEARLSVAPPAAAGSGCVGDREEEPGLAGTSHRRRSRSPGPSRPGP